MTTSTRSTTKPAPRDLSAEIAFLTRALKAPTLRQSVERLAQRARAESWTHEQFLIACLHARFPPASPTAGKSASGQPASRPAKA
jgi:hypothetical protein